MKKTLEEAVKNRELDKKKSLAILLSIARLIEQGQYFNLAPEYIILKENYEVEINTDCENENPFFLSPEQLFYGKEIELSDLSDACFSFGMLCYYTLNFVNWYIANSLKVYDIINLIRDETSSQIYKNKLDGYLNKLIFYPPYKRKEGLEEFFNYWITASLENYVDFMETESASEENQNPKDSSIGLPLESNAKKEIILRVDDSSEEILLFEVEKKNVYAYIAYIPLIPSKVERLNFEIKEKKEKRSLGSVNMYLEKKEEVFLKIQFLKIQNKISVELYDREKKRKVHSKTFYFEL